MTKTKSTKRALLMSALALLMCVSMLVGSTFAWFTDSVTSAGNKIQAGTLKIDLELLDKEDGWASIKDSKAPIFNYDKWEPGYTDVKILKVENEGTLALKWYAKFISADDLSILADVIDVYVCPSTTELTYPADRNLDGYTKVGTVRDFVNTIEETTKGTLEAKEVAYLGIALKMQETAGNEYQGLDLGAFDIMILATQNTVEEDSFDNQYDANAEYDKVVTVDAWDGTADTSWYNDTDTEFVITTAEQLAGLADLVDAGNTFEGKTIKLDKDLDLYVEGENGELVSFDPIGYGYDIVFKGTFDGQGHTIKNLYQNGWSLGLSYGTQGGGLFASVVDATIKNINIDNAEVVMECVDMGVLVGYSYGNCTYENITVSNSLIANYQRYTGGVVGEVNGTQTFKNVDVKDTVISSLWGDFDCSLGGIIGGKWGDAVVTMENCDVACELNAYNDVTSSYQWYAYRRAGMLIGNSEETKTEGDRTSAAASYLTAVNCTVTYGDWVDYTYCEFAGTSWPYVRVQEGYSNSAYSNPRYGHPTDANGNEVVDDNHVHNEGEDHFILCEFDQLYGGGQGVYGTAAHEGVTIIYNNK